MSNRGNDKTRRMKRVRIDEGSLDRGFRVEIYRGCL